MERSGTEIIRHFPFEDGSVITFVGEVHPLVEEDGLNPDIVAVTYGWTWQGIELRRFGPAGASPTAARIQWRPGRGSSAGVVTVPSSASRMSATATSESDPSRQASMAAMMPGWFQSGLRRRVKVARASVSAREKRVMTPPRSGA